MTGRSPAAPNGETGPVHVVAAVGGGFLLAVLWFDLMFDVQVGRRRGEAPVPDTAVVASIAAYYRRVTTDARPMNRLVAAMMLVTLGAVVAQLVAGTDPPWMAWASLVFAVVPIGLAAGRTVRNAVRLGAGAVEPPEARAALARLIYRDHVVCFACVAVFVAVQVVAAV